MFLHFLLWSSTNDLNPDDKLLKCFLTCDQFTTPPISWNLLVFKCRVPVQCPLLLIPYLLSAKDKSFKWNILCTSHFSCFCISTWVYTAPVNTPTFDVCCILWHHNILICIWTSLVSPTWPSNMFIKRCNSSTLTSTSLSWVFDSLLPVIS